MPFIDSAELARRISSNGNLITRLPSRDSESHLEVTEIDRKRKDCNLPIEIKKTVALLANDGESSKSLEQSFGISQSTVSQMRRGLMSNNTQEKNPEIAPLIQKRKEEAETKAIDSLLTALELIPTKLQGAKLRDLNSTALTMASVADRMKGSNPGEGSSSFHLHLHVPKQKQVDDYEVIDV